MTDEKTPSQAQKTDERQVQALEHISASFATLTRQMVEVIKLLRWIGR